MNPDDYEEYSLLNHEGRRLANSTSAMEIVRASRWSRFKAAIVADIPDDMAGCGDCKEGECSQARFATCPQRLIAIDEQKARR